MTELIDKQDLLMRLNKRLRGMGDFERGYNGGIDCAVRKINNTSVIEIVYCKDCKYWCANYCTRPIKDRTNMFPMGENDFCSCGAQMELVSKTDELKCSEKPNSSVKIPVISMEDVPKLMEEKE